MVVSRSCHCGARRRRTWGCSQKLMKQTKIFGWSITFLVRFSSHVLSFPEFFEMLHDKCLASVMGLIQCVHCFVLPLHQPSTAFPCSISVRLQGATGCSRPLRFSEQRFLCVLIFPVGFLRLCLLRPQHESVELIFAPFSPSCLRHGFKFHTGN